MKTHSTVNEEQKAMRISKLENDRNQLWHQLLIYLCRGNGKLQTKLRKEGIANINQAQYEKIEKKMQ